MGVLRSLALAFSCFSKIPVPQVEWNDENKRFMMACFPLVGVVSGALVALWCWVCAAAGIGVVLRSVGIVLVPVAVTGGIHLDGFADVVDALSSHAEPERRRAILKDPHVGAFAVIGVAAYLLLYAGVASEMLLDWRVVAQLAFVQVLVRCESGFATVVFSGASEGMLASFRTSASRASLATIVVEYVLAAAALVAVLPASGLVAVGAGLACLAALHPFARRNFGGMSGDVAGFFLQVCELVMVACVIFVVKAVGL